MPLTVTGLQHALISVRVPVMDHLGRRLIPLICFAFVFVLAGRSNTVWLQYPSNRESRGLTAWGVYQSTPCIIVAQTARDGTRHTLTRAVFNTTAVMEENA